MSLYDNPLPPADYAAYLALRDEMYELALPYSVIALNASKPFGGWEASKSLTLTQRQPALAKPSAACKSSVAKTMVAGNGHGTTRPALTRQKPCAMPCSSKPTVSSTASNG